MSYEIKKEICVRKAVLLHTNVYTFDKSFRRDIKMMTNFHVVFKRQMEFLHIMWSLLVEAFENPTKPISLYPFII